MDGELLRFLHRPGAPLPHRELLIDPTADSWMRHIQVKSFAERIMLARQYLVGSPLGQPSVLATAGCLSLEKTDAQPR